MNKRLITISLIGALLSGGFLAWTLTTEEAVEKFCSDKEACQTVPEFRMDTTEIRLGNKALTPRCDELCTEHGGFIIEYDHSMAPSERCLCAWAEELGTSFTVWEHPDFGSRIRWVTK